MLGLALATGSGKKFRQHSPGAKDVAYTISTIVMLNSP